MCFAAAFLELQRRPFNVGVCPRFVGSMPLTSKHIDGKAGGKPTALTSTPAIQARRFLLDVLRILARTSGGSVGAASMRLIIDAERPLALWLPLRIVQAVLRGSPKILACSSSVRKPAASTVSASSLILDNWRARPLALRTCAKGSSWFMQIVA